MSKTIAFMNEKGGVGKTTTVLECAYHASVQFGLKCLVVDLDAQANATKMLTGQEHIPSVFDLLVEDADIYSILKPTKKEWGKTLCLPADRRLGLIESHLQMKLNRESVLKKHLATIKKNFDLILLDLPPIINSITINALVAADGYLVPSDVSEYSKSGIKMVKKIADEIVSSGNNPKLKFVGIVLTSFQKGGAIAVKSLVDEISKEYKEKLLKVSIPDSVKVTESQSRRIPVGEIDLQCTVSKAYHDLTQILVK